MKWVIRSVAFVAALFVGVVAVSIVNPHPFQDCIGDVRPVDPVIKYQPVDHELTEFSRSAQNVTVCELKRNPAKYNHKLILLTGYFSRGFEDSSLSDPACEIEQWIWVEMGGKRSIGVMYCCGFSPSRVREADLTVEGIRLPIEEDSKFNEYDNLLAGGNHVGATVIGTFFSGEKRQNGEGPSYYGGYGHMGIGSLFVVQQVFDVAVTMGQDRHQ